MAGRHHTLGWLVWYVQARLPALQQDVPASVCESREELVWRPNAIADVDLLMYLRAAR